MQFDHPKYLCVCANNVDIFTLLETATHLLAYNVVYTSVTHNSIDPCNDEDFITADQIPFGSFDSREVDIAIPYGLVSRQTNNHKVNRPGKSASITPDLRTGALR